MTGYVSVLYMLSLPVYSADVAAGPLAAELVVEDVSEASSDSPLSPGAPSPVFGSDLTDHEVE